MSDVTPVVVIGSGWRREVYALPATRAATFGGPTEDFDVGATGIVATIHAHGSITYPGGTTHPLHDGERVALGTRIVELRLVEDVDRERADQRYLETILDPLTGLYTRRFLHAHARARPPAALLVIDLDRLKTTNDRHGIMVGDRVLQHTAIRLRRHVRWPELVARSGGEEFLVLLPAATAHGAESRAEAIRQAMLEPVVIDGEAITSTVSIGVAMFEGSFIETWQRADDRCGMAKTSGRNRVVAA